MNENNPQHDHDEALAPLDAFEQQWVDQLAQREPDLAQTEDAFVQRVMQTEAASAAGSAVIGRIGFTLLPYAIAAALLLAAFVGWSVLQDNTGDAPDSSPLAEEFNSPTQPESDTPVVDPDRPKIALGVLIANAKSAATKPATTLTTSVSEAPDTLRIDRLFDLLGDSIPDLKEILAPLEPKNKQSRA